MSGTPHTLPHLNLALTITLFYLTSLFCFIITKIVIIMAISPKIVTEY